VAVAARCFKHKQIPRFVTGILQLKNVDPSSRGVERKFTAPGPCLEVYQHVALGNAPIVCDT
jgi:hypothetical protein